MQAETLSGQDLLRYVDGHSGELVELVRTLVRIPSENTPPVGAERACQEYCAGVLRASGFETEMYEPTEVGGLREHRLYWPGRAYAGRPNVAGRLAGTGRGRSLILSGHMDTVPRGTQPWTRDPFGGEIEEGRLYGRGSNDMKAGVAIHLFVARAVAALGMPLRGDLVVETVVDEEFGGVNGTLAGRLRGYVADAAILGEPSFLRICPSQRGGHTAHITFHTVNGGILADGMAQGIAAGVGQFLTALPEFAELRRRMAPAHPSYGHLQDPVPVSVLKIHTGAWGMGEPMATADTCRVELYWQSMPGEEPAEVTAQFANWLEGLCGRRAEIGAAAPVVEYPIRTLPGSSIAHEAPLVRELAACAAEALGKPPEVAGIEGPCDMFVFQQEFGIPAVSWGPRGGNTHMADEYVELDSVVDAAKALLLFVHRWCNLERGV